MKVKLLKYVVGAVLLEEDDDGNILREIPMQAQECYNRLQLDDHLGKIDEFLANPPPIPQIPVLNNGMV